MLPRNEDYAEFNNCSGASFHASVFNLSCTIVGAGIMSLPATLKVLGLVPGIVLIIFAAFLTEASVEMLLRFSKPGSAFTYGDVMGDAFGMFGKMLLQTTIVINNIGAVIIYLIIIGVTPSYPTPFVHLSSKPSFCLFDWSHRCYRDKWSFFFSFSLVCTTRGSAFRSNLNWGSP